MEESLEPKGSHGKWSALHIRKCGWQVLRTTRRTSVQMLLKMRSHRRQPAPRWEGGTRVAHTPCSGEEGVRGGGPGKPGLLKHGIQGGHGNRNRNWAKDQPLGPALEDRGERDHRGGETFKEYLRLNPWEKKELLWGQTSRNTQGKMLGWEEELNTVSGIKYNPPHLIPGEKEWIVTTQSNCSAAVYVVHPPCYSRSSQWSPY